TNRTSSRASSISGERLFSRAKAIGRCWTRRPRRSRTVPEGISARLSATVAFHPSDLGCMASQGSKGGLVLLPLPRPDASAHTATEVLLALPSVPDRKLVPGRVVGSVPKDLPRVRPVCVHDKDSGAPLVGNPRPIGR